MAHFLLLYDLTDDYLERRTEFRAEHLALATVYSDRGRLRYGGALADPVDRAALVFDAPDETVVREFVEADPYVRNGLVRSWHIRQWNVVVGADYEGPAIIP